MTTVVTGASGHVGSNLVRALLADGQTVRAVVHRDQRGLAGLDVELVEADVCEPASLDRAFEGAETVYHAAALISLDWSDWERLRAVNVTGTRNVIDACIRSQVQRLIHFSSTDALDLSATDAAIDEDCTLVDPADSRGVPAYDRSKAASEVEVREGAGRELHAVVISPTAILGPHDYRPSHQGQMLLALANRRLPGLVAGGYDWVDVRDVVAGAMAASRLAPPGSKYILSGHWASLRELAQLAQEATGVRAPSAVFPIGLARLGAPLASAWAKMTGSRSLFTRVSVHAIRASLNISHARASHDLCYHPRPLHRTIEETYQWLVETGRLNLTSTQVGRRSRPEQRG